jgi:hypothetical protein
MFPMLNKHLNNDDNFESKIKDNQDVKEIEEENSDEEIEFSSSDSGITLCAKVGLGLLGATVIALSFLNPKLNLFLIQYIFNKLLKQYECDFYYNNFTTNCCKTA